MLGVGDGKWRTRVVRSIPERGSGKGEKFYLRGRGIYGGVIGIKLSVWLRQKRPDLKIGLRTQVH